MRIGLAEDPGRDGERDSRGPDLRGSRESAAAGIRACFFLQFGYPGEGWSEIEATIRMVRETAPDDIGVSVSYPLPGTKFHRDVLTQIGSNANWSDSDDLAMMFQGAYPSEFYRALADALHTEVRGGGAAERRLGARYIAEPAGVAEAVA